MDASPRRQWFRFSVRTLLIGVALLSILGAIGIYLAQEWRIVQQRKNLLREDYCEDLPGAGGIGLGDVTIPSNSWIRRLMKDGGAPEFVQFQPDAGQTDEGKQRWRAEVGRWRRAFPETKITFFAPNDPDYEVRWRGAFPEMNINVIMPRDREWRGKDGRKIPQPERAVGQPVGNGTNWKAVIADYEGIIQREPNNASAIHFLARIFAAVKHFQNLERAIELATKAGELTDWEKAQYLETLAIAHSENGDFATAVRWMEKAVSLEPENEIFKTRLEGFKASKPFREHPIIVPTEEADAP